jgi:D-aminoacyl-tRNA deacylase
LLFVELGSSEKQWVDENAASVICEVLLNVIRNGPERCGKVGIGLGGTHYPGKFNRLLLDTEFGLAAVASKHSLESVDESMMHQMIAKSVEKVTNIVLDGKGLGSQKDRITRMAEKTGLEILNLK